MVKISNWVPDPGALGRVLDDPNCFTFQEMFPGGFTPQFGGDASDASLVVGLRGHTHGGLLWDVSGSFGQNMVDFFIDNTVNASLGPQSPASFDPGIYMQREIGANLDLNYTVNDMINVAGGAEFRDEYFEIGIGETASWEIGPFAPQGFSAGSNGFPGFSNIAAGGWHRVNYAVYGDVELHGRQDRWTVGTALRMERFEDFGTTANGKVAARYGLTDVLAVRASASTGFRAPTPGQQNAFNVSTQFDRTLRELVNNGTIPSTSRVAEIKGGKLLDAEKSANASLGVVIDAGSYPRGWAATPNSAWRSTTPVPGSRTTTRQSLTKCASASWKTPCPGPGGRPRADGRGVICRSLAGSATTPAGLIRVTTGSIRVNSLSTWRPPTR